LTRRALTVETGIWSKADGIKPGIVVPPSNWFLNGFHLQHFTEAGNT